MFNKSPKLKDLSLAREIYLKADKSKAEMEEYRRLGKRDMLKLYHTKDGIPPRVELEKSILKIDGVEVESYKYPQTLF